MYAILGSETGRSQASGQRGPVRSGLKDGVPHVVAPVTARDDVSNQVGHGPGQKDKQKTSKGSGSKLPLPLHRYHPILNTSCFREAKLIKT